MPEKFTSDMKRLRRLRLAVYLPALFGTLAGIPLAWAWLSEMPGATGAYSLTPLYAILLPLALCFGLATLAHAVLLRVLGLPHSPIREKRPLRWLTAALIGLALAVGFALLVY